MPKVDMCKYPHCCCATACLYGGKVPRRDPTKAKFRRKYLIELAERHELVLTVDDHPGYSLSNEDQQAIAFALRHTAETMSD